MENYSEPSVEKLIQSYGFNSLYKLFEHIIRSHRTGQHKQARTIFHQLPALERLYFFYYLRSFYDVLHWIPMYQTKDEYIAYWKRYLNNEFLTNDSQIF